MAHTQCQRLCSWLALCLWLVATVGALEPSIAAAKVPLPAAVNDGSETARSHEQQNVKVDKGSYDSTQSSAAEQPAAMDGDESSPEAPSEVQKAVCTVTTGDVQASAEAVTTKTLKGVCGSAEMNLALQSLESKLYRELQEIKLLLRQLSSQQQQQQQQPHQEQQQQPQQKQTITATVAPMVAASKPANGKSIERITFPSRAMEPKLKSLTGKWHQREQEVSKFNNTLLGDRDLKVFNYYWKLENFTDHIRSGRSEVLESAVFSIKGKPLRIKASFQHLHRDFLHLQLEHEPAASKGSTRSSRNNIVLDTGIFKEIVGNEVTFKHKISILDQGERRGNDLVSQEFTNLEKGFLIPNSALLASSYIKNNALLIQIFLYL